MVRFLHTADLHLDRPFEGVRPTEEEFKQQLASANRKTLENIVNVALKKQVDFVIIAGDTFHQDRSSPNVQKFLIDNLNRLNQAQIPVIMIFGNHDYYNQNRFWFDFPDNVILFTAEEVETKYLVTASEQKKIAFSAFSYQNRWIEEDKGREFPLRDPSVDFQIGIYHGDAKAKNYAPFTLSELQQKKYDYWALGHLHLPEVLDRDGRIRYCGAPIGHTRKEQNSRTVNLVELTKNYCSVEAIKVATASFSLLVVDAQNLSELKELQDLLNDRLTDLVQENTQKFIEIKLENVAKSLAKLLNEQELIEFFNQLNPPLISISKISWKLATDDQNKIMIPFTATDIEQVLANFQENNTLEILLQDLLSKKGVDELIAGIDFSQVLELVEEDLAQSYQLGDIVNED